MNKKASKNQKSITELTIKLEEDILIEIIDKHIQETLGLNNLTNHKLIPVTSDWYGRETLVRLDIEVCVDKDNEE